MKEAIGAAFEVFREVLAGNETESEDLELEQVTFDVDNQNWLVTLSYRNAANKPVTESSSAIIPAKTYKRVSLKINDQGEAVPVSIEAVKWNI